MNHLLVTALLVASIGTALMVAPSSAANQRIPMCEWSGSSEGAAAQDLIEMLNLQAAQGITASRSTGGCFKVEYVEDGMFVTYYYDPDMPSRPVASE